MNNYSEIINYLEFKKDCIKKELSKYPRMHFIHRGTKESIKVIYQGECHEHQTKTAKGQKFLEIYKRKRQLENKLREIDASLKMLRADKMIPSSRSLSNSAPLTSCRNLFSNWDDLVIRPNTHTDRQSHMHNGIDFDSKTEVDIAKIYDLLHIPYKHAAVINLGSYQFAADLVPLIEETGDYFIHEHFGREMVGSYLNTATDKYQNLSRRGLILGRDYVFTYENHDNYADTTYLTNTIFWIMTNIWGK